MRKVLLIAGNSLLRMFRDPKALAIAILMPMILIGILGAALKDLMTAGKINPFDVLIVNADRPLAVPGGELHLGRILQEEVLGAEDLREIIRSRAMDDLSQARADVAAGKAVAAIHVPAGFTADVFAGKPAEIEVITDPGRPDLANIVVQVARAFTDAVTSQSLAARQLPPGAAQTAAGGAAAGGAGAAARDALPALKAVSSGVRPVAAFQYYAAAMAVMYMMMTALGHAATVIEERQNGTLSRMLASPTARATILAGQIMGSVAILLAQFLILLAGTHWIYGVYWGPLLPTLAIGFSFAVAASGCGMAAAGLLNDAKAAGSAVGVIGPLFAALSGAMAPLWMFPDAMKAAARLIPNYWALQAFLDQMASVGLATLWAPVAVLIAIGLCAGAVGAWRLAAR